MISLVRKGIGYGTRRSFPVFGIKKNPEYFTQYICIKIPLTAYTPDMRRVPMKLNVFVYVNGKKMRLDELSAYTICNQTVSQIITNVEARVAKTKERTLAAAKA